MVGRPVDFDSRFQSKYNRPKFATEANGEGGGVSKAGRSILWMEP